MTTTAITPLRQRMIEDMNARKLCASTQKGHILRLLLGHEKLEITARYLHVATGMISAVPFHGWFRHRPKRHSSIRLATSAVHPVWWLPPMPAPLSPWKYS
jgi:hypothetical protein